MSGTRVSQSEIARMAGVGRAAVGNWRVRYADFPRPVGGDPRHPEFNRKAVEAWITRHAKLRRTHPAAAPTPPILEGPLLALLRRAHARMPGVWLLHEQLLSAGIATAPLIRGLVATGVIERRRAALSAKGRTLLRLPHTEDVVDRHDVERRANAILAEVGYCVTVYPGRGAADEFAPIKITHRGSTYTGYHHRRPWTAYTAPIT